MFLALLEMFLSGERDRNLEPYHIFKSLGALLLMATHQEHFTSPTWIH
jgi:hypothetical protein